jgi:hypothetical protein
MLTDGNGIPLAVVVDGANRNDDKLLLAATLVGISMESWSLAQPPPPRKRRKHPNTYV